MPTLNQNMVIGAKDKIARYGTVLNPGAFDSEFPETNLQDPRMWLFSRFASNLVANTYVIIDLGDMRQVQLFACLKHNMGNDATWRIRVANTEAGTTSAPIYDTGWIAMTPYIEPDEEFEWSAQNLYEDSEGINRHAYHVASEPQVARYLRFDFDDSADVATRPDNYIHFARLWASVIYQPSLNMVYGAEVFIEDATGSAQSENMVEHFHPLIVKQRRLVATFNDLPSQEFLQNIMGTLFMQLGRTGEIIGILRPLVPEAYPWEAVYGRLVGAEGGKHTYHGRMSSGLQIKESV